MSDYSQSIAWLTRAKQVIPTGASTLSKRSRAYVEGACPTAFVQARGCRLWDVDNREYIDWTAALCAVSLGYCHPHVDRAVKRQIDRGWIASLPSHLEASVTERFLETIPCGRGGMARWVNSGTEASEAAIRVARRVTGHRVIVSAGYHGWTSAFMALQPFREGIPDEYWMLVEPFAYNDLASLDGALAKHDDDVAAVFLEPTLAEPPAPGFLEGVRERAHRAGALVVYDEVVCGRRWSRGGAQEYFGVLPDLATFGKAIANGYGASCLVGSRELMADADVISGTFGGNAGVLSAVDAVCDVYEQVDVCAHLWAIGAQLQAGLRRLLEPRGLIVTGQAVRPKIEWPADPDNRKFSLLIQELAARGVLVHFGGFNPTLAHGEFEVAETLAAFEDALDAIDGGVPLKGLPFAPAFQREPVRAA